MEYQICLSYFVWLLLWKSKRNNNSQSRRAKDGKEQFKRGKIDPRVGGSQQRVGIDDELCMC